MPEAVCNISYMNIDAMLHYHVVRLDISADLRKIEVDKFFVVHSASNWSSGSFGS
jgi:hypothetical protein